MKENYWWGIEDICIWACVAEYIHYVILGEQVMEK